VGWAEVTIQLGNCMGLVGVLVSGRKRRLGWMIGAASEIPWTLYAWLAHTPGLYPWNAAWAAFYLWNWRKWKRG
jgi:hypothetical protein